LGQSMADRLALDTNAVADYLPDYRPEPPQIAVRILATRQPELDFHGDPDAAAGGVLDAKRMVIRIESLQTLCNVRQT